jgi:transcription elongation factor Elf1
MTKWTKEYQKEYDKARYKRMYAEKSRRQEERRTELREWFAELKSTLKCGRCPENHPACLQFHHLRDKTIEVSCMIGMGYGKENILKEIGKCVILCGNCHAKEHFNERQSIHHENE